MVTRRKPKVLVILLLILVGAYVIRRKGCKPSKKSSGVKIFMESNQEGASRKGVRYSLDETGNNFAEVSGVDESDWRLRFRSKVWNYDRLDISLGSQPTDRSFRYSRASPTTEMQTAIENGLSQGEFSLNHETPNKEWYKCEGCYTDFGRNLNVHASAKHKINQYESNFYRTPTQTYGDFFIESNYVDTALRGGLDSERNFNITLAKTNFLGKNGDLYVSGSNNGFDVHIVQDSPIGTGVIGSSKAKPFYMQFLYDLKNLGHQGFIKLTSLSENKWKCQYLNADAEALYVTPCEKHMFAGTFSKRFEDLDLVLRYMGMHEFVQKMVKGQGQLEVFWDLKKGFFLHPNVVLESPLRGAQPLRGQFEGTLLSSGDYDQTGEVEVPLDDGQLVRGRWTLKKGAPLKVQIEYDV